MIDKLCVEKLTYLMFLNKLKRYENESYFPRSILFSFGFIENTADSSVLIQLIGSNVTYLEIKMQVPVTADFEIGLIFSKQRSVRYKIIFHSLEGRKRS